MTQAKIRVGDLVRYKYGPGSLNGRYIGYVERSGKEYLVRYLDGGTTIDITLKDLHRIFILVTPEEKARIL
jgi:hypothetical protein